MRVLQFTYIKRHFNSVLNNLPFAIMRDKKVVAVVSKPTVEWFSCEVCGDNTQNLIKYPVKNDAGETEYKKLVLCDECKHRVL